MTAVPIPSVYNEETGKKFFNELIPQIDSIKDLSNLTLLRDCFQNWNTGYHRFDSIPNLLETVWIENNATDLLSHFIVEFNKKGFFSSNEIWFPAFHCLGVLWNFTDCSFEICKSLLDKKEFMDVIIFNSTNQAYIDKAVFKNIHYLIKTSVSIIHNIARYHGFELVFKKDKNLKSSLIKLIRINDSDYMGIISTITLSMLVEEDELELLEECQKTIKTLCLKILICLQNGTGRTNGFAMWELLNGLRKISVNDNMKKEIVNQKGLGIILDILKRPSYSDLDAEMALGTLWNLCFDKEIREKLNSDEYKLKDAIEKFKDHSNENIKKAYVGIMWLLDQKKQKERVKSAAAYKSQHKNEDKWKYDVFISYSWANKVMVYKIRDELKKKNENLRIWLDVDQMQGSTIEAMATGIEQSRVFLMFASEAYRTSPNCRTEAEYAFSLNQKIVPAIVELRYKPTGWLGFIIGSKTYFEFSERREFAESIAGLYKSIMSKQPSEMAAVEEPSIQPAHQNALESAPASDNTRVNSSIGNSGVGREANSSSKLAAKIKTWTKADVDKWLIETKQTNLKTKLIGVPRLDGRFLYSLIDLSWRTPDYLFVTLKTEYGLKLADIVHFNAAIDDLHN